MQCGIVVVIAVAGVIVVVVPIVAEVAAAEVQIVVVAGVFMEHCVMVMVDCNRVKQSLLL